MAFTQKQIKDLNRSMRSNQNAEVGTFLSKVHDFTSASGNMALQSASAVDISGGEITGTVIPMYAGVVSPPTITDSNGTLTIGEGIYSVYSDASGSGFLDNYTISGSTFVLADSITTYIYIYHNGGVPTIGSSTNFDSIPGTKYVNTIPIITAYRYGNLINYIDWDTQGLALSEKLLYRTVDVSRFERTSGLILGEYDTRAVKSSEGTVWYGANQLTIPPFYSGSSTSGMYLVSHDAVMTWTGSPILKYDNTQYQTSVGLAPVGAGKYVINWVYEVVSSTKSFVVIVLGTEKYNLNQAITAPLPSSLPNIAMTQAILIGRIIVLSGADTATQIDSSFDITFSHASLNHNDLASIQGGIVGEYYHLTAQQYADFSRQFAVTSASANITLDRTMRTILVTGGSIIQLPTAVGYNGIDYNIKTLTNNTINVVASGSQTIDGSASQVMSLQYTSMSIISDNNNWHII